MSSLDANIIADVGTIFSTIYDHSVPLRREEKFFLKGFEGKNGIGSKVPLEATVKEFKHLNVKGLPECIAMAKHVHDVASTVDAVATLVTELGKVEGDWAEKQKASRDERSAAHQKRMDDLDKFRLEEFGKIDIAAADVIQQFNEEGLKKLAM
eukprot:m.28462 g.28462  ORF g.28462 m.28462 type:complete len:153 (-) comp15921_c0_seq1:150-608(-)